ncbi:MAG: divalent-cation tolerance protein CutA [Candidatus Diapherotrites archaeon]|nr:divalent-cation tolerance protein CutA [Candidatus Diapherotrites archaeon]
MSCIGFVTCKSTDEARKIAQALLGKKLIACANIIPNVESMYWWNGKIETATETLLLLKTNPEKTGAVISAIEADHSYELSAIEFINVDKTTPKTQQWINQSIK